MLSHIKLFFLTIDMKHPKTLLIRHRRENKKKCSLQPLLHREDCHFLTYPGCKIEHPGDYLLLSFEGKELSKEDADRGLLLLDGTWKRATSMEKELFKDIEMEKRSLPKAFKTAYPRRQPDCENPDQGLASVEALYIAYLLMGRDPSGLLDEYHWKELFLEKNKKLLNLHLS